MIGRASNSEKRSTPRPRDVLRAARRMRAAALPPQTACEVCDATDPLVLEADAASRLCADCAAIGRRLAPVEQHHLGGRSFPVVTCVSANAHRILSALQRARGPARRNACELLYGVADLLYTIAERCDHLEEDL